MKSSRYSPDQVAFGLRQAEEGTPVAEVCRKIGISEHTIHRWMKKFQGVGVAEVSRLGVLEEENRKLKQLVADLSLDKQTLQGVLQKSPEPCPAAAPGRPPRGGRGIAHPDPGSATVHGRAVAGPPAGGLSWPGPGHRRYPPGGVHPTGTGVCRSADHSRRELCPTICMLP